MLTLTPEALQQFYALRALADSAAQQRLQPCSDADFADLLERLNRIVGEEGGE